MLAAGANTEARDKDGNTPLHVAAQYVDDYVSGDEDLPTPGKPLRRCWTPEPTRRRGTLQARRRGTSPKKTTRFADPTPIGA